MNIKSALTLSLFGCLGSLAHAYPVSPNILAIPSGIIDNQENANEFVLFRDHANPTLIHFVPKLGNIAIQGASTGSPTPRFAGSIITPTAGLFAGKNIVSLGGSFDTTGNAAAISILQNDVAEEGWQAIPATATRATTNFLVTAKDFGDGRPQIECSTDIIWGGTTCEVLTELLDEFGNPVTMPVDSVYEFVGLAPLNNSSVSQIIPFQTSLLPGYDVAIEQKLAYAEKWDNLFTVRTAWQLDTRTPTSIGRIHIQWDQVFTQAETYFSIHNWACIDLEVQTFFRELAVCPTGECGISVEFLHPDGSYRPTPPAGSEEWADDVYKMIREQLEPELFRKVAEYSEPVIGPIDTSRDTFFTIRANYQKLLVDINETRYLYWRGEEGKAEASTVMNIDCLTGSLETTIEWDTSDAYCRSLAGI